MGIAYQPRVQTLGINPEKQPRVLKERRIASVSRTSTTASARRRMRALPRRRINHVFPDWTSNQGSPILGADHPRLLT